MPLTAIAAMVKVVRPTRSANRPAGGADADNREAGQIGEQLGLVGGHLRACQKAGVEKQANPGPHGVELPHMAEIAEIRQTKRFVAPRLEHGGWFETRTHTECRAKRDEIDQHGRTKRQSACRRQGKTPVDTTGGIEQVGERRAYCQRTNQQPDQQSSVFFGLGRGHLHADRINPRHAGAGNEAECDNQPGGRLDQ